MNIKRNQRKAKRTKGNHKEVKGKQKESEGYQKEGDSPLPMTMTALMLPSTIDIFLCRGASLAMLLGGSMELVAALATQGLWQLRRWGEVDRAKFLWVGGFPQNHLTRNIPVGSFMGALSSVKCRLQRSQVHLQTPVDSMD